MPTYRKGDEKKYFPFIIGALLALSAAVGYFIYSLVYTTPGDLNPVVVEERDGTTFVNPGGAEVPTYAPNIEPPVTPPPGN